MNNLDALQKLYVRERTITLPKNPKEGEEVVELSFEPLSLEDLALFGKSVSVDSPPEESAKIMYKIFAKSLNVSEDEIKKISFQYMNDLMEYMSEINNMNPEDKSQVDKVKGFMQQRDMKAAPNSLSNITKLG